MRASADYRIIAQQIGARILDFMLSLSIGIAALIAIGSVPDLLALISAHLASMGGK